MKATTCDRIWDEALVWQSNTIDYEFEPSSRSLQHEEFAINQSPKNMMTLVIGCSSSLNVLKSQKIFLGSLFGSHCEELVALMREDEFFAELCKQNKKKCPKVGSWRWWCSSQVRIFLWKAPCGCIWELYTQLELDVEQIRTLKVVKNLSKHQGMEASALFQSIAARTTNMDLGSSSNNKQELESLNVSLKSMKNSKVNQKHQGSENFYMDIAIAFMKPHNNSLQLLFRFAILVQKRIINICMEVANFWFTIFHL